MTGMLKRLVRCTVASAIAAVFPFAVASAQNVAPTSTAEGRELVYVQATKSKDLIVFDAHTFELVANILIGDSTDDVIGSADGTMAFANAILPSGNPFSDKFAEAGKIFGIDTRTSKIVWSVFVPGTPNHLATSVDGTQLFVSLFDRNYLYVLDPKNGELIARWHTIFGNHGLEVTGDGSHLVAGNMLIDAMLVFNTKTGETERIINTREGVRPFAFGAGDRLVYYQLSKTHGFEVRDLTTGRLLRTMAMPREMPVGTEFPEGFPHTVDHGLAISPDKSRLFAATSIGDYIAVYALPELELLGTIDVGRDPNWIDFRSDSKVAFVSNRGENTVSVIDVGAMREITRLPAGTQPQRLSVIRVPGG